MQSFLNRTAFITGGAGGIGAALACEFVERGASVVIADLDLDRARSVAHNIDSGGRALAVNLDVTDAESWRAARGSAEQAFGRVDILCSNAGVGYTGSLDEIGLDAWRWVYEVNVIGAVHAIQTFIPGMKARGAEAHVLFTSSITALHPFATQAAYTSSKAALLNLARTLQLELSTTSIGVSVLCPGMVATNLRANAINARPEALRASAADSPLPSPLSQGMAASAVARVAVEAILANRFYVFTHSDYREAIASDSQAMLDAMLESADPRHREPSLTSVPPP
ncbi:MAG TPA: SDR family oxidoreductase [Steroidobacter sp.]|nr:SDR family oxidoreductase [Steroidobacter sp.]